jgi:hypothetical protein
MARKPSETVSTSFRIKEALRRQIEQSAIKRGVSFNTEISTRMKESFEREMLLSQWQITEDMKNIWGKWGDTFLDRNQFFITLRAAEFLIKSLPPELQKTEPVTELNKEITAGYASFRRIASGSDSNE